MVGDDVLILGILQDVVLDFLQFEFLHLGGLQLGKWNKILIRLQESQRLTFSIIEHILITRLRIGNLCIDKLKLILIVHTVFRVRELQCSRIHEVIQLSSRHREVNTWHGIEIESQHSHFLVIITYLHLGSGEQVFSHSCSNLRLEESHLRHARLVVDTSVKVFQTLAIHALHPLSHS